MPHCNHYVYLASSFTIVTNGNRMHKDLKCNTTRNVIFLNDYTHKQLTVNWSTHLKSLSRYPLSRLSRAIDFMESILLHERIKNTAINIPEARLSDVQLPAPEYNQIWCQVLNYSLHRYYSWLTKLQAINLIPPDHLSSKLTLLCLWQCASNRQHCLIIAWTVGSITQ